MKQVKHCLWYLPVRRPSAEETERPLIASPHPLQLPFAVVGRRAGAFSGDACDLGNGERRPPWIAGSIGDSGASIYGSSFGAGCRPRAYCLSRAGDILASRGFIDSIEDCKSAISESIFVDLEGCGRVRAATGDLPALADRGGLEVELALLALLEPDVFED